MDAFEYCPAYARVCVVEAPECLDGHGADCPERVCVECGSAFLLDPVLAPVQHEEPTRRTRRRSAAA